MAEQPELVVASPRHRSIVSIHNVGQYLSRRCFFLSSWAISCTVSEPISAMISIGRTPTWAETFTMFRCTKDLLYTAQCRYAECGQDYQSSKLRDQQEGAVNLISIGRQIPHVGRPGSYATLVRGRESATKHPSTLIRPRRVLCGLLNKASTSLSSSSRFREGSVCAGSEVEVWNGPERTKTVSSG